MAEKKPRKQKYRRRPPEGSQLRAAGPFVQDVDGRHWFNIGCHGLIQVPACPDCPPCTRAGRCVL